MWFYLELSICFFFEIVTYGLNFNAKVLHLKHGASWCFMPLDANPSATFRARTPNLLILRVPNNKRIELEKRRWKHFRSSWFIS